MSNIAGNYYETYWSEGGFLPHGKAWPELVELYRSSISPHSRVIDVGCGDGGTSGPTLSGLGHTYLGVDISKAAVERAEGAGFSAQVVESADSLSFPDDAFDAVVCIEVLEHLFDPLAAVREMRRVLSPGGVLIATTPNFAYWRNRVDMGLLGRFNPRGDELAVEQPWRDPHIRFFTPRTLGAMLQMAGFDDINVHGQQGGILNGMPFVGNYRSSRRSSTLYRLLETRVPALFGYRLAVVAR